MSNYVTQSDLDYLAELSAIYEEFHEFIRNSNSFRRPIIDLDLSGLDLDFSQEQDYDPRIIVLEPNLRVETLDLENSEVLADLGSDRSDESVNSLLSAMDGENDNREEGNNAVIGRII